MREVFEKILDEDRYDEATHRAFADWLYEQGMDAEAEFHAKWTLKWQKAKDRLEEMASESGTHGYGADYYDEDVIDQEEPRRITCDDLIQAGHDWVNCKDYFVQYGDETLRDKMQGDKLEEFWECWEIVTGRQKPEKEVNQWSSEKTPRYPSPFSCSC